MRSLFYLFLLCPSALATPLRSLNEVGDERIHEFLGSTVMEGVLASEATEEHHLEKRGVCPALTAPTSIALSSTSLSPTVITSLSPGYNSVLYDDLFYCDGTSL
jgi:hypothetical protein